MIEAAVILAGGLGTRLRSVVSDRPKPMADVSGKPFLEYLVERLASNDIQKVVICVSYMKENIISYFEKKYQGIVSFSVEETPLGTGGALANASPILPESFLVLNGDTFLAINYQRIESFHRANKADLTMVLAKPPDSRQFGNVKISSSNRIIAFGEESETALVNAGIYIMEHRVLEKIPKSISSSLEKEFFPRYVKEAQVYGYISDKNFVDIGSPESYSYLLENRDILKK